jgi:tRNA (cmo5U34)-methyltransferase
MDNSTPYRAFEYDAKVRQTIPFYDTIHTQVIRLVKAAKPEVGCWIDTGCGTGHLVQQALPVFPSARFILADPSEAMLGQARSRLSGAAAGRITFASPAGTGDLEKHLPLGSADVITAIQCHHYLHEPERLAALKTCHALLRPGGLLIVCENTAPRTETGVQIGLKVWRMFLMRHGRSEQEADQHLQRYGTEFFPLTLEQHFAVMAQAGFQIVESFWHSQMQSGFYAIK